MLARAGDPRGVKCQLMSTVYQVDGVDRVVDVVDGRNFTPGRRNQLHCAPSKECGVLIRVWREEYRSIGSTRIVPGWVVTVCVLKRPVQFSTRVLVSKTGLMEYGVLEYWARSRQSEYPSYTVHT